MVLKHLLDDGLEQGNLDRATVDYLLVEHPKIPLFHHLPKTHKSLDNVQGRHIISGVDSLLEYKLDSQPLRPCELAREKALLSSDTYIPQCTKEGLYRNIQCDKTGLVCWCVSAEGLELPGSKRTRFPVTCLSFCQLKKQEILLSGYINSSSASYVPQCTDTGEFEEVQCDQEVRQCWCVDSEGMEIYGTRQTGKPAHCPKNCEVRDRRILHGVGEKNLPYCSEDGKFFPVQCKLLNTTDNMALDIITSFSRAPDAFKSFTSLQESFPEISGYCYCADSLGRELADTGLELLLDEVYDTVFAGLSPSRTFTETTIYRILQRRFLGIQLITSGKYRCPTTCEVQRATASKTGDIYIPSCDDNGDFLRVQCQTGGQCWCVDSKGREIYGTRITGDSPNCNYDQDCPSKRRQALSTLFYGPSGYFGQHSLFSTQEEELRLKINKKYCSSYIVDFFVKSGLLLPINEQAKGKNVQLDSFVSDMVTGLFPSRELIQLAISIPSSPKRFQQNLFGGKFLKNIGAFNFTSTVGKRSKFNFSTFFQQIGLTGMYSGGNFKELAKLFSSEEDSYLSKGSFNFSKQSFNLNQPIQSNFGRITNLQENQNIVSTFSSILELTEFVIFLEDVASIPPTIARNVADAVKIIIQSKDCDTRNLDTYVPSCTKDGRYEDIQCNKNECWCVDDQGKEIERSRRQGKRPRCPTNCEKEHEKQKMLKANMAAGSEVFIPACDRNGDFMAVQCAGKNCFCVDVDGRTIPGTKKISGESIQCPSYCQLAAGKAFLETTNLLLSGDGAISQWSSVYVPQCKDNGNWQPIQCSGPTEQTLELYKKWKTQNKNITFSETFALIMKYKDNTSKNFTNFVQTLYDNEFQDIFPIFSKYSIFNDIPKEILDGTITIQSDNVLLNPYVFWKLLSGSFSYYPGPYSDFSTPLTQFELRSCWCVDQDGQKLHGTEKGPNKFPKCPGTCELAKQKALEFIGEAEELIQAANLSHIPFGHSYLLAAGIRLTESELLHLDDGFKSGVSFSERFLIRDNYALQLAAISALHFYWRGRFALKNSFGQTTQLSYLTYIPQCDGFGNWEPVQVYESTGHYWCVDENGHYIPDSLVTRTSSPPQCRTSCQRVQTNAIISSWIPIRTHPIPDVFIPSCTETGEYSSLQKSETNFWCVSPVTGNLVLQGVNEDNNITQCPGDCTILKSEVIDRNVGTGIVPECGQNEAFSPGQCEQDICYCLFPNGEVASGTQINISERERPTCKSPMCPFSFGTKDIKHGAMFCEEEPGDLFQNCQLVCRKGYWNVFSRKTFICDKKTQRWVSQSPHRLSCQKAQSFQTVKAQADFQVILPSTKTCMADYSASLQAFRTFLLDDLKARGLCHIQVSSFGSGDSKAVPVCDESTVYVECLSADRLGVNVTWRAQLEDIPQSLPSLHDIETAFVGEDLVGRFLSIVKSGNYTLYLDSKRFVGDTSVLFPQDDDFSLSPQVTLSCADGFQKHFNSEIDFRKLGGCVICPEGSYSQNEACAPCAIGFYQDKAGSTACIKCPLVTTTAYFGAYKRSQCVTSCQMNDVGLQCDNKGQYLPSQKNTNKYYCADLSGEKLQWTEVDTELSNEQCLILRKFELIPEDKLILTDENLRIIESKQRNKDEVPFLECIMDCAKQESCDYLTVTASESGIICDQYNEDESNVNCTATKQKISVLGNSASFSFEQLNCQIKIKRGDKDILSTYRKKGQEFPKAGLTVFEKTDFKNTVSGVYTTIVFSANSTTLTNAHSFCRQTCREDSCCEGFILSEIILNKGTILCGLLRSPDVLLCNINDWRETSGLGSDGVCKGVKSNKEQKMFSFFLGGQEFTGSYSMLSQSIGKVEYSTDLSAEVKEEIQQRFTSFQRVYLQKDKMTLPNDSGCILGALQSSSVSDSAKDLFLQVDSNSVVITQEYSVPSQQFGISKKRYSSKQAMLWCLTRCAEEESWCRLADLRNATEEYFTCIIYPNTWKCNNVTNLVPNNCDITLYNKPQLLYHKKDILGTRVKNFYSPLLYRKLSDVSVRNKIIMSGKTISNGFFECELQCDADPCCKGFGYLQRSSEIGGSDLLCLTLSNLGVQSCRDEIKDPWHVMNCSILNEGMETRPFGWYQKPESQETILSALCPLVNSPRRLQEASLDNWLLLDGSSVITDPSLSTFDEVQISNNYSNSLTDAQNYCLSECSRIQSCALTTIELKQTSIRCMFYPETQTCYYSLNSHHCQVLVKEQATYVFRKKASLRPVTSVTIASLGPVLGKSQAILIGSSLKNVNQFLGIPYAAPPVGDKRFHPPQPFTWTGTWNSTTSRASCLQPGDGKAQYSSVSEDCLYLNVFVPQNIGTNAPVLLYFYNSPSDYSENGQTFIDGSHQAAIGNIIVVTASFRVGVFGFLLTGTTVPSGNWGLLDQAAALKWVQENIVHFGGDPGMISLAADRSGADASSLHLLLPEIKPFRRAILMGGSAFSPALVISERRAQEQLNFLAKEVGCNASGSNDVLTCLRSIDADVINAAQTKLLAVRGPFQTWGPVVDNFYIRESPSRLLEQRALQKVDLLIGSSEQDGLISRAKAIKRFEESEGRGNSKTLFYQALQNSLGGEEMNPLVQDAAVWFYSLEHSTDDYAGFSRGLENSTRDHFIACPSIRMARHWSENSKGNVYMYHMPQSVSQSSTSLDLPEDVIYAFGLPFHSNYKNQFSIEERDLSLKIMQYVANFVKTGNPNFSYTFSRKVSRGLPAWSLYRANSNGRNYMEFSISLGTKQGLKEKECSFWNDYIPALQKTINLQSGFLASKNDLKDAKANETAPTTSPVRPIDDKDSYSR
ncbi:thyroglobulin [Bombina bombina]|uniref:thyroglobulin n=1 Tax=Bombina bombina TaxID=8345 RepID=UPI00235B0016|nr:thyroglobulin [Bombina bombina]